MAPLVKEKESTLDSIELIPRHIHDTVKARKQALEKKSDPFLFSYVLETWIDK